MQNEKCKLQNAKLKTTVATTTLSLILHFTFYILQFALSLAQELE